MDHRIGESMEHLSEARAWDLETNRDVKEQSWAKRASERGDTVLDQAGDSSLSYRGRDRLYALAVHYYEFGQWKKQSERAQSMRDSIQSDLAAEVAENEAKMEQAEAEIRQKAEAASQAAAEMMKTEEEKQDFKKEADAMEAELGF
jgi:chromosome segregation ATPase